MSAKYHIGSDGNAHRCSATVRACPYGGEQDHYPTPEAARAGFEAKMGGGALALIKQTTGTARERARVQLETIHGSHLYGLNRPGSDLDTYRVVVSDPYGDPRTLTSLRTRQRIDGEDDVLETNLTAFLLKCNEGVPQALEAMFSRKAPPAPLDAYRYSYYLNTAGFAKTYKRTVMNFARLGLEDERAKELLAPTEEEEMRKKRVKESVRVAKPRRVERNGMLKYRRHALRLMLNRETGLEFGRFNPTLSDREKDFVLNCAELEDMKYAVLVKSRVSF